MTKRTRRVDTTLLIAFAQFVIIVLLLSGVSAEYQSNRYMQDWISQNAWPLGYLLNGYLASTLVGVAIGGAFLLLQRWRSTKDIGKEEGSSNEKIMRFSLFRPASEQRRS